MDKSTHGGKRSNSGRKPRILPNGGKEYKKQISLAIYPSDKAAIISKHTKMQTFFNKAIDNELKNIDNK